MALSNQDNTCTSLRVIPPLLLEHKSKKLSSSLARRRINTQLLSPCSVNNSQLPFHLQDPHCLVKARRRVSSLSSGGYSSHSPLSASHSCSPYTHRVFEFSPSSLQPSPPWYHTPKSTTPKTFSHWPSHYKTHSSSSVDFVPVSHRHSHFVRSSPSEWLGVSPFSKMRNKHASMHSATPSEWYDCDSTSSISMVSTPRSMSCYHSGFEYHVPPQRVRSQYNMDTNTNNNNSSGNGPRGVSGCRCLFKSKC
jgi:hypothetical protein